jgi:hypothetical protein
MKIAKQLMTAGIAAMAALVLLPDRSYGWGNTWMGANLEQIVKAARLRLGPIRYNASLTFSSVYDSDIYFGSATNPVPDYSLATGPQLRFYLPIRKGLVLEVAEIPQYMYFVRSKQERTLNNVFQSQIHLALERWYFRTGAEFKNVKERVSTELNFNVRRRETDLSGLSFLQLSQSTSLSLQFRSFDYRYENPAGGTIDYRAALDRREHYVDLTAFFQTNVRTRIYMAAEYGSFVFTEAPTNDKDSRSYSVLGGIDLLPPVSESEGERGFLGKINLGYKHFTVIQRAQNFDGLVGNTSLSVKIFNFATIQGIFSRDIQFSAFAGHTGYVQTTLGAGISRNVTRRLIVSYDLSVSRNDYEIFETANQPNAQRDTYFTQTLLLAYRLQENFELRLSGSLGSRRSNLDDQIHRRSYIGLSLTYGYRERDTSEPAGKSGPTK